ncbi:hypothetical protein NEMIN01_0537 [Nematocida minor]|uniref:uncharacterized protein n=1 Tax=Nematocida minor TaxID=1912983 RepID=UPI00221EFF50|nr:uncharacterized protein NEMIN01_0537 [Nematocida minor]KAI5189474.1 hypothetical protein NEMIN01_0537 [Nematocida minor]
MVSLFVRRLMASALHNTAPQEYVEKVNIWQYDQPFHYINRNNPESPFPFRIEKDFFPYGKFPEHLEFKIRYTAKPKENPVQNKLPVEILTRDEKTFGVCDRQIIPILPEDVGRLCSNKWVFVPRDRGGFHIKPVRDETLCMEAYQDTLVIGNCSANRSSMAFTYGTLEMRRRFAILKKLITVHENIRDKEEAKNLLITGEYMYDSNNLYDDHNHTYFSFKNGSAPRQHPRFASNTRTLGEHIDLEKKQYAFLNSLRNKHRSNLEENHIRNRKSHSRDSSDSANFSQLSSEMHTRDSSASTNSRDSSVNTDSGQSSIDTESNHSSSATDDNYSSTDTNESFTGARRKKPLRMRHRHKKSSRPHYRGRKPTSERIPGIPSIDKDSNTLTTAVIDELKELVNSSRHKNGAKLKIKIPRLETGRLSDVTRKATERFKKRPACDLIICPDNGFME